MFRYYYDSWVMKPLYWQCFFILGFTLSLLIGGYFFCIKESQILLRQQFLENLRLKQALEVEKNKYQELKNKKTSFYIHNKAHRYLETPRDYLDAVFLIQSISRLILKEGLTLKQIALKSEKEESDYRLLLIHLSVQASYKEFIKLFLLIAQQPYLKQTVQFKLTKFNEEENGDKTLYADLFINVYVFK